MLNTNYPGNEGRCTMVAVLEIENRVHIFFNDTQG